MPIWLVTPDFVDYDLYKEAVIVAPTKQAAEMLAFDKLTSNQWVRDTYGVFYRNGPQKR